MLCVFQASRYFSTDNTHGRSTDPSAPGRQRALLAKAEFHLGEGWERLVGGLDGPRGDGAGWLSTPPPKRPRVGTPSTACTEDGAQPCELLY